MTRDEVKTDPQPTVVHPSEEELRRFMRGELLGRRLRVIVRHLLTRCPQCRAVTDQALPKKESRDTQGKPRRGRRPRPRGDSAREAMETEAQALLRERAADIQEVRKRLKGLVKGLPPSPQELNPGDLDDDPDITSEVRAVVQCVLADNLEPAIEDLLAAAAYRPRTPTGPPEQAPAASLPPVEGGLRMPLPEAEPDARCQASEEDVPAEASPPPLLRAHGK